MRLLHVAPEPALENVLRLSSACYTTSSFSDRSADLQLDLRNINLPDASFDAILCLHVLEHIDDDRRALAELYRILSPEGWALIQVPIVGTTTYSDPTVVTEEDRKRVYGHPEHQRNYGLDYPERLRAAGFSVAVDRFAWELPPEEAKRYGILREVIYFSTKPALCG